MLDGLENLPVMSAEDPALEPEQLYEGGLSGLRRRAAEWWNRDRQRIKELEEALSETLQEHERSLEEVERLEEDLRAANSNRNLHTRAVQDAAGIQRDLQQQVAQLRADLRREQTAKDGVEGQLRNCRRTIEMMNLQKQASDDERRQREKMLAQLEKNVVQAREQAYRVGEARDRLSQDVDRLEKEMQEQKKMSDERATRLVEAVRALEGELQRMQAFSEYTLNELRAADNLGPWPERLDLDEPAASAAESGL
jgi:chromosome segregation ATPase